MPISTLPRLVLGICGLTVFIDVLSCYASEQAGYWDRYDTPSGPASLLLLAALGACGLILAGLTASLAWHGPFGRAGRRFRITALALSGAGMMAVSDVLVQRLASLCLESTRFVVEGEPESAFNIYYGNVAVPYEQWMFLPVAVIGVAAGLGLVRRRAGRQKPRGAALLPVQELTAVLWAMAALNLVVEPVLSGSNFAYKYPWRCVTIQLLWPRDGVYPILFSIALLMAPLAGLAMLLMGSRILGAVLGSGEKWARSEGGLIPFGYGLILLVQSAVECGQIAVNLLANGRPAWPSYADEVGAAGFVVLGIRVIVGVFLAIVLPLWRRRADSRTGY